MKRHWHVIYGTMIIFFIACAIAIPNQSVPWVLTAIMTCTAMMWHRAQAASWQMYEARADSAERWREVACNAMEERDAAIGQLTPYQKGLHPVTTRAVRDHIHQIRTSTRKEKK